MIDTFEGAEIDGKRFPFVRLTVNGFAHMSKKLQPTLLSVLISAFFPAKKKKRWWKKVRAAAFVKRGSWRIGIVPKELRCSVMLQKKAEEIEESFFRYAGVPVQEQKEPSASANPTQTLKNELNEKG